VFFKIYSSVANFVGKMFKSIKHVDQANASPFFQQYAESNLNSLNLDDFMFVHNADTLEFNNSGLEFTSTNYNLLNDENYDTEIDFSIIDSLPKTDQSQIKCDETAKCLGSPIQSPMYFLEGLQSIYIPPNYHDNKTVLKQGKDNCIIDFTSNVADKNANITDYFENNNSIRHKQLIIQSNKLGFSLFFN
jgi:hypothetical protein